jgi:Rad3-related DNA helicase
LSKQCNFKKKVCLYKQNYDRFKERLNDQFWEPLEIEELYNIGKDNKICAYYLQKDRIESTNIMFLPYVYLIDQNIKSLFKLNLKNSIIIIDEAHNIAQQAE